MEISNLINSRIVKTKAFSERLSEAINRYHTNALTTAQVLEELIALAKEIRAEIDKKGNDGLTEDEIAFYEALSENDSAVDLMGDEKLKLIANELLKSVRSNATVDWHHSEMARAKIRVAVKRILKNMDIHRSLSMQLKLFNSEVRKMGNVNLTWIFNNG